MRASETFVRASARARLFFQPESEKSAAEIDSLFSAPPSVLGLLGGGSEGCAWNRPRSFSLSNTNTRARGTEFASFSRCLGASKKSTRPRTACSIALSPTNQPTIQNLFPTMQLAPMNAFLFTPTRHITLEKSLAKKNSFWMTFCPLSYKLQHNYIS